MKTLYDTIAELIGTHVLSVGNSDILKSEIAITVLYSLYNRFILEGIPKIENLTETEKQKYWNMIKLFSTSKEDQIIKSKAAYVLSLITSQ